MSSDHVEYDAGAKIAKQRYAHRPPAAEPPPARSLTDVQREQLDVLERQPQLTAYDLGVVEALHMIATGDDLLRLQRLIDRHGR